MQVDPASSDGPARGVSHQGAIKISTENEIAAREADIDRANFYTTLGALLAAPASDEHVEALRKLPVPDQPESALEIAWTMLGAAAHQNSRQQIDDEYHDLFIGIGRGIVVPYGSWHLTGFLMEKPLSSLRADLRRLGFERSEGVTESEDHIASLCQAMAAIIVADEIDLGTEKAFFNEHIGPWAEDFFRAIEDSGRADFYRAVAHLGQTFIEVEKTYLAMTV